MCAPSAKSAQPHPHPRTLTLTTNVHALMASTSPQHEHVGPVGTYTLASNISACSASMCKRRCHGCATTMMHGKQQETMMHRRWWATIMTQWKVVSDDDMQKAMSDNIVTRWHTEWGVWWARGGVGGIQWWGARGQGVSCHVPRQRAERSSVF